MQNYQRLELLLGVPLSELKTHLVVISQNHENLNYSGESFTRSVYKGSLATPILHLNQIEYIAFSTGVVCIDLINKNTSIKLATILFTNFIAQFGKDVNEKGTLSLDELNQCLRKDSSVMRYWCFNAMHEPLSEEADDDGYEIMILYSRRQLGVYVTNIQNIYQNTTTNTT